MVNFRQPLSDKAEVNTLLWSTRRIDIMHDPVSLPFREGVEPYTASLSTSSEGSSSRTQRRESALSAMSTLELEAHCKQDMSHLYRGDSSNEQYGLELFCRAGVDGDQEAWIAVQHCFNEPVREWLRHHPHREAACSIDNEEHYVALAFARCWQTLRTQQWEYGRLSAFVQCLHVCLNGVILETLRARSREVSLPAPYEAGKPHVEESTDTGEVWEHLKAMLPDEREQRLAYLLFHCGLKSKEIMAFCPQEFNDVQEISRLRRNIMERLLRNADSLRWQLN
jgi:hypothetical protein